MFENNECMKESWWPWHSFPTLLLNTKCVPCVARGNFKWLIDLHGKIRQIHKIELEANPFYARNQPQDQQRRSPFHAKVKVDCWSSLCQSSIPPARINGGNRLFTQKWKLTLDPLCQSLIHPLESTTQVIALNRGNCLCIDCWSTPYRFLTF